MHLNNFFIIPVTDEVSERVMRTDNKRTVIHKHNYSSVYRQISRPENTNIVCLDARTTRLARDSCPDKQQIQIVAHGHRIRNEWKGILRRNL